MEGISSQRSWLLMAAGDNRGHGGNSGYDDQFDAYYSWDSKVPNHKSIRVGDPVALWDKERLLGISVIEEIETSPGRKVLHRCVVCKTTRITERKKAEPRFRCNKCHHEFDFPHVDEVDVIQYKARYDAAWTSLDGILGKKDLQALAVNPGEFNAMRPLDWASFCAELLRRNAVRAVERVVGRAPDIYRNPAPGLRIDLPQGFRQTLVRVRRGQRQFREQILANQGSVCAFTGGAPARALEAGHLYSYAQLGTHFNHGGLMLRRDIHRLFDDGLLAVNPSTLRIDVASELSAYPQYARLHDGRMAVQPQPRQVDWLNKHWAEHRARPSTAG